jgi:hypothetical protein
MTSHLPLLALLNNPVDLTFFKPNLQYVRELCVIDIVDRLLDLSTGIARGCSGWFRVNLYDFVRENGTGGETVMSMTCRSPFQSLFASTFLQREGVEVDFSMVSTGSDCKSG